MDPKFKTALDSLPPESLVGRSKFIKGFIFGEQGVGKTKLACELAEDLGILIATDTGTDTLYNHPHLLDKIKVVPYDGLAQLTAIGQAVIEGIEPWCNADLLIVDTISQIAEEYLDFLNDNFTYGGTKQRDKAVPRRNALKGLSEEEVIGLPDYHLLRNNLRTPVKTLIKAPIDVVFIAHEKQASFMAAGIDAIKKKPNLPEASFLLIGREVSFLGKMEQKGNKRTIKFQNDTKTVAKSRIKELDNKEIDAELLPEIIKKWKGNL